MTRRGGRVKTATRVSAEWPRIHSDLTDNVRAQLAKRAPRRPLPSGLYHFTDCSSLTEILRSRTLWASLATSLNDRSETQHAVSILRGLIRNNEVAARTLPLGKVDEALNQPQLWRHYVVSFCAEYGTALHWLHYGRSGTGVAVGFDSPAIKRAALKTKFKLYPVLYDEKRQKALLTFIVATVDRFLSAGLKKLRGRIERELLVSAAVELVANEVWTVAPRMKAPVFEPEKEWRLVASIPQIAAGVPNPIPDPTGVTEFRSAAGRVVPYKKLHIDPLPVVAIVIGSSAPFRQDPLALQVLLEGNSGTSVKLLDSPVPVRP